MDLLGFTAMLQEKGFNIVRLCKETRIPRSTMYRRLESGFRTMTLGEAKRISEALGVPEMEVIEVLLT